MFVSHRKRGWSKGQYGRDAAGAKDRQIEVGGESPTHYHLLKRSSRPSTDFTAHSFFILGLESDRKSTKRMNYSAYNCLSNRVIVIMRTSFNKPTFEESIEGALILPLPTNESLVNLVGVNR